MINQIKTKYLGQTAAQRRASRMQLDIDSVIMPGGVWWLFTVLIGVGGTILYVAYRDLFLSYPFGRFVAAPLDFGINEATNAFRAAIVVTLVMLPMLQVTLLAYRASPLEKREIYYLLHAGLKTLVFGSYPKSSSRTLRTKIARNFLWLGDVALAKVGASLVATTLGIALYDEAHGARHPFITIDCVLITYLLFLYPRVIRTAMAWHYRHFKIF